VFIESVQWSGRQMAVIKVRQSHALGLEGARLAVQQVAERLREELKADYRWESDCLVFECPGADGRITTDISAVEVTVNLSWLLSPMRGRIEQSIHGYLEKYLA
jgi:putative polyhydroxyalkanoate system protein